MKKNKSASLFQKEQVIESLKQSFVKLNPRTMMMNPIMFTVEIVTVIINTEYRDRWLRDSIHVHDSIFMFMKGDTVFRDRWHVEYRNKLVYDTTYINRTDSICVPYPIEKQLSRWESIKMELGGWAFGIVIGFALIMAGWLIYRLRRRYK